jgi:hypothetical protein
MRSSPVLSVAFAIAGWLALGSSLFMALFEGGKTGIAAFLAAAGCLGVVGVGSAVWGMRGGNSRPDAIFAAVGLTLAVGVLIAGAIWGLDEFNR